MISFLHDYYPLILSLHIIAVMFWMAGLYYLPRLFVYHCQSSEPHLFLTMEQKLLRVIMLPSMLAAWGFGILLMINYLAAADWQLWLIIKLALVLFLSGYHGFLSGIARKFSTNSNPYSEKFFRVINELGPVATIIIVILVIYKP